MVKLYCLAVIYKNPESANVLKTAYELSSFGYFQRSSVQEFMNFTCNMLVERSEPATRQSVRNNEYLCHVYVRADKLAGAVISDHEYPHRVAHTLLNKVLDDFANAVPPVMWPTASPDSVPFGALDPILLKYQNPQEADSMTRIQNELDETNIILHNAIENMLKRGENLDNLVAKSEALSLQSKMFYKTARKTNSCCSLS